MAAAAAVGIARSIYPLQRAQMCRHVGLVVPVNLLHLMNIDHAHPDTFLGTVNRKSVASERRGDFSVPPPAFLVHPLPKTSKHDSVAPSISIQ